MPAEGESRPPPASLGREKFCPLFRRPLRMPPIRVCVSCWDERHLEEDAKRKKIKEEVISPSKMTVHIAHVVYKAYREHNQNT